MTKSAFGSAFGSSIPTIRGRPAASMIKKSLFEPNKPHPVSKIMRPKALKEERVLTFPKSPAFSV